MDRRHDAFVHGADFDVVEFQPLVEAREVFLIAAQPVEAFDQHGVELAGLGAALQVDQAVAVDQLRYSEHLFRRRRGNIRARLQAGLEGIVSKRLTAPYQSGKVKTWLKTKNPKAAAMLRVQEGGAY